MDEGALVDRRTVVKVAAGTLVGGGVVALGIRSASDPAVAASGLTARDASAKSADGEVQRLTIAPTVTIEWENYRGVSTVALRFRADGPQSNGTVIGWTERSLDTPQSNGEVQFDLDAANMLSQNGGPLDGSSFSADEGDAAESDVTVSMDLRFTDADGNTTETRTPLVQTTYTVQVTDLRSKVTVSGRLNTGVECVTVSESLVDELRCRVA
ncbi:MAG: hypothetical protein ABEJ73_09095 [Haloplanus sp.]